MMKLPQMEHLTPSTNVHPATRRWNTAHCLQALCLVLFLGLFGCSSLPRLEERVKTAAALPDSVFLLDFDNNGALVNADGLARAISYVQGRSTYDPPVRRIIVLSYGWFHDRDEGISVYRSAAQAFLAKGGKVPSDSIVVCVSWNSSSSAVDTAIKDIIPGPRLGELMAAGPRALLFPLTFWSKARLADTIGYGGFRHGGLNEALTYLIDKAWPDETVAKPALFLVGHSFGSRILAALTKTTLGGAPLPRRAEAHFEIPFKYLHRIDGAVFFQPALTRFNLPESESHYYRFPVVVTQSRHDHANGFLYPVGNLAFNAYTSTASVGIIEPMFGDSPNILVGAGRDFLTIVGSFAFTAVLIPTNYAWAQINLIASRGLNHIGDTLAQLPLIEWPVDELAAWAGIPPGQRWGNQHLGLFELGAPFESAGRVTSPAFESNKTPETLGRSVVAAAVKRGEVGCFYVDESDRISASVYSAAMDLNRAELDYTTGWEPIGAHARYEPAYDWIDVLLNRPEGLKTKP